MLNVIAKLTPSCAKGLKGPSSGRAGGVKPKAVSVVSKGAGTGNVGELERDALVTVVIVEKLDTTVAERITAEVTKNVERSLAVVTIALREDVGTTTTTTALGMTPCTMFDNGMLVVRLIEGPWSPPWRGRIRLSCALSSPSWFIEQY
jgi:hypothetical protein